MISVICAQKNERDDRVSSMTNKIPNRGIGRLNLHTSKILQGITGAFRFSKMTVAKKEACSTSVATSVAPIKAASHTAHLNQIDAPEVFPESRLSPPPALDLPRSVDMAFHNRIFALNMFVMVRNPRQHSVADMNALQDKDFHRMAQLIFNGLDACTQVLNLADPDQQCGLTHRALSELEHPVFVQPQGIFELKTLLKWWLDKGTHPLSDQAMALEQIEKIRLPSTIARRSSI
jgi:hypothetical protein